MNLVLAELREEGDEATRKFIEGMSAAFKLEPAKVLKVLENLPFVLAHGCTLDEARALAEKVQAAGGVCRLQEAQSIAPTPQQVEEATDQHPTEPEPPEEPAPAEEGQFGSDMDEPPPASLVGEAKVGTPAPTPAPAPDPEESLPESATIPLATGGIGGGRAAGTSSSGAGGVKCIECGEVQPPGPACRNCSFPLPEK